MVSWSKPNTELNMHKHNNIAEDVFVCDIDARSWINLVNQPQA